MRRYTQLAYLFHQCATGLSRDSRIADCTVRHPGVERPFSSLFICWRNRVSSIWMSSGFATTLLHHAPPKVTSVLVLFVIFGGLFDWCIGTPSYALSFHFCGFSYSSHLICCVVFTAYDSEVVECGHELTLLLSSFSFG